MGFRMPMSGINNHINCNCNSCEKQDEFKLDLDPNKTKKQNLEIVKTVLKNIFEEYVFHVSTMGLQVHCKKCTMGRIVADLKIKEVSERELITLLRGYILLKNNIVI